jgi:signal transduction histidine kinase
MKAMKKDDNFEARTNHPAGIDDGTTSPPRPSLAGEISSARDSSEELGAFASAVVQEARAPLRHIEAFTQLLKQRSLRWDEESQHYLEALAQGVAEMRGFLEVLFRFCRAVHKPLAYERVSVSELAGKILARLHRNEPHRNIKVVVEPGIELEADPELLEILLAQLLDNAWKFTRGVPRPEIRVGRVPEAAPVTFFIRDSGVGFPQERVSELFRPLGRLHPRHEYPGAGFGLATAACIVRRHGGSLTAQGTEREGATFLVTLPQR